MRLEILIDGMLAVHARHAVFTALAGVEGILRAEVELGRAVVEHDGRVEVTTLQDAVTAAGFAPRAIRELPRTLPTL
jgi:copper chaperone CopZ